LGAGLGGAKRLADVEVRDAGGQRDGGQAVRVRVSDDAHYLAAMGVQVVPGEDYWKFRARCTVGTNAA